VRRALPGGTITRDNAGDPSNRDKKLRPLVLLALLSALFLPASYAAAQDVPPEAVAPTEPVVVPNFWDPRARIERPSANEIGAIRFLTTDDFPPFAFRDRRGLLVGFDIDLAQAICSVLKVQCAIQIRPFHTLVAGLKDGTGNAIIAGFDLEKAPAEGLIATQAYLKIPGRFVIRKDAAFDPGPPAPEGFVGVVCNSAHAAYLTRFFPDLHVACFMKASVPLEELKDGTLDAVFGDALSTSFWLNGSESADCCRFSGGAYLDDRYFGPGLAIVMKAEDRALKSALDYALREVHRAGTYEELYLRYFPVGLF
jgi:polar amino acid transport system substrate-binding protein